MTESGRGKAKIDMSSDAIDRRLERVAQLLSLCRELAEAKRVSDVKKGRIQEEKESYGDENK